MQLECGRKVGKRVIAWLENRRGNESTEPRIHLAAVIEFVSGWHFFISKTKSVLLRSHFL